MTTKPESAHWRQRIGAAGLFGSTGLCFLSALFFGASAPFASLLAHRMDGFLLAGLLYVGAALAMAPFAAADRPTKRQWKASTPRLAGAVIFGGAVGPALLALGLAHVTAGTASLLLNLELVFTTFVAGLVFREYIGLRIMAGTVLVMLGSVLLTWTGEANVRWGALLIAGACLAWAVDNAVTAALDHMSAAMITVVKGTIAGGANCLIGVARSDALPSLPVILAALAVGAVGYGVSMTLWVQGARNVGAARGQLIFSTAPFLGALVVWVGFWETPTLLEVAAAVVAAAGVGFVVGSSHEHDHEHHELTHTHTHTHNDDHHDHEHHEPVPAGVAHSHEHTHTPMRHRHHHMPDLHHRHDH